MSQRAFLAELDAEIHEALADAGLGDVGLYTPPGDPLAEPVPCEVYVDRAIQTMGEVRQAVGGRVEVAYVLKPGLEPAQHGTLDVDGERYQNASPISDDGSLSRWLVRRVGA